MGSIAAASSNSDLVGSENRLLCTFGTVTPVPGPRKQADDTDWMASMVQTANAPLALQAVLCDAGFIGGARLGGF